MFGSTHLFKIAFRSLFKDDYLRVTTQICRNNFIVTLNHEIESDPELVAAALLRQLSCWNLGLNWHILFFSLQANEGIAS